MSNNPLRRLRARPLSKDLPGGASLPGPGHSPTPPQETLGDEDAARRYSYDPSQRQVLEPQLARLGYALPEVPRSAEYEAFIKDLRATNPALAASVEGMVHDQVIDDTNPILKKADQDARRAGLPKERLNALFTRENAQGERVFNKQAALAVLGVLALGVFASAFFSNSTTPSHKRPLTRADQGGNGALGTTPQGTQAGTPTVASSTDAPPLDAGTGGVLGTATLASSAGGSAGAAQGTAGVSVTPSNVQAAPPVSPVQVSTPPQGNEPNGLNGTVPPSFPQAASPTYVPPQPSQVSQVPAPDVSMAPVPARAPQGAAGTPQAAVPGSAAGAGFPTETPPSGVTVSRPVQTAPAPVTLSVQRVSAQVQGGASAQGTPGGVVFMKNSQTNLRVVAVPSQTAGAPGAGPGAGAAVAPAPGGPSGGSAPTAGNGHAALFLAASRDTSITRIVPTRATSVQGQGQVGTDVSQPSGDAAAPVAFNPPAGSPTPLASARPADATPPVPDGAAVPAPKSPYRMGQRVLATLETGVNIAQGASSLPVYASTADGTLWRGTVSLDAAKRVNVLFDRARLHDGTEVAVAASAYNLDGTPGLKAQYRDIAPTLANDLIRAAVSGVNDFVQATIQATTTSTNGNAEVVQRNAPTLLQSVAGSAANVFQLPPNQQTFVTVATLPMGSQFALVYGQASTQNGQGGF